MIRASARLVLALALTCTAQHAWAAGPPVTVDRVDLARYMGRWHEVALLPNFFQRRCVADTTAEYALREDGLVSVTNRCRTQSGEIDQVEGVARVVDPETNAKLEVSFVSLFGLRLFWGDYWVLGLGDDYDYALIGTPSRRYGWILARDPNPSEAQLADWLKALAEQGYDPKAFVRSPRPASDAEEEFRPPMNAD